MPRTGRPLLPCTCRSTGGSGARHSERPGRQNISPPKRHPLGLIGGLIEESHHPAVPSKEAGSKEEGEDDGDAAAFEGRMSLCNSAGSDNSGNAIVADDSRGGVNAVGVVGRSESGGFSRGQTRPGEASLGTSRGGGSGGGGGSSGSGSAGASLFDMVMSGASCSSQPSSNGGSGGGGRGGGVDTGDGGGGRERSAGTNRLSVAATTGGRAEGGKPIAASSLSGILGGMRGGRRQQQQPQLAHPPVASAGSSGSMATDNGRFGGLAGRGTTAGADIGGGGGGLDEDWMAMNLEKLSTFRVPETRMGFPEGAREVQYGCGGRCETLTLDGRWEGKGGGCTHRSPHTTRVSGVYTFEYFECIVFLRHHATANVGKPCSRPQIRSASLARHPERAALGVRLTDLLLYPKARKLNPSTQGRRTASSCFVFRPIAELTPPLSALSDRP